MSFALASASSMQRVFRDRPFDGPVGKPLQLAAAMNSWTSGQVVIIAGDKRLRNVRVEVSDLKSWEVSEHPVNEDVDVVVGHALIEGPPIPAGAIEAARVRYVEITEPSPGMISPPGWYPDPLEPITSESRFEVDAGAVQPIWLRLKVPPDTRARNKSLYRRWYRLFRGPVTVHADVEGEGAQSQQIDIELRVFKFSLPRQRILRFWTMVGSWAGFYNWLSAEEVREIDKESVFLLARFGITSQFSLAEGDQVDLDECERFYKKLLDLGVSHLQIDKHTWPVIVKNGWEDIAYHYFGSEWPKAKNIEAAQRIRKAAAEMPLVKVQVAGVKPSPYLDGVVNVWVYPSDETLDSLKDNLARGEEAQWYACCRPEGPHANVLLDCHQIEPRILMWQAFQYGVTGFLYWRATCLGAVNPEGDTPEEKWPNRPWHSLTCLPYSHNDGQLLYPGPDGMPWSSIRLENLRDGADDYDYLCILRDYVAKLKKADFSPLLVERAEAALKVNPDLSACKTEYTRDPAVVERERRRVGSYIEEARATLGEIGPIFPSGFSSEE